MDLGQMQLSMPPYATFGVQTAIGVNGAQIVSIGIANIFSILRIDYVRRFNYLDHPDVDEWGIFFSLKVKF